MVVLENDPKLKSDMLSSLVRETYLNDIVHRNRVRNDSDLEDLFGLMASNIGCLTNPAKLSDIFLSVKHSRISESTVKQYIDYLMDSFLLTKAVRYDIKGKRYISTPCKYYFSDTGLRNALIGFRQIEPTHLMENVVYNQLRYEGYSVDVGVLEQYSKGPDNKTRRGSLEIDFVCNRGSERLYVQSSYSIPDESKLEQEQRSLALANDSFPKIILTTDNIPTHRLDNGIVLMNVYEYLLR